MILDELLKFSDGQTVTGGSAVAGTNHIETGAVRRNLGTGRPLYLVISIITAAAGDGSDTFDFSLVGDTVAPIDGSSVIIATKRITGVANVAAGTLIVIPFPPNATDFALIGTYYTTTADAVLTLDAYLTDDAGYDHKAYPDATEGVTV